MGSIQNYSSLIMNRLCVCLRGCFFNVCTQISRKIKLVYIITPWLNCELSDSSGIELGSSHKIKIIMGIFHLFSIALSHKTYINPLFLFCG